VSIEVRPIEASEFEAIVTMDARAFGLTYTDEDMEDLRRILELDRTLVALDGPEVVGSTSAFSFEMTVPGGAFVPTAGVTWVGVMPTHRRRGILRQLMARQLDEMLDRGEPLAALSASESSIYGRFGYGVATRRAALTMATKRVRLLPGRGDGQVRFADPVTARKTLPGLYDRQRALVPGTMSRDDRWWDHILADLETLREGATTFFFLVHPDGYAVYRRRSAWANGLPGDQCLVSEVVAVTPEAHASLWRVLLELDLVERLTYVRYSIDDPLPWLLDDSRRLEITGVWDDEWVRLLHVPRALEARRYLSEDRFVLELVDAFRPAIGGRFELDGGAEGAVCRRTTAEPDLVMDISDMGSLYLGGVRASILARAGRIEERTAGAARRADAFFASDPPPHNQTGF
jgi:predicted acetyltransferase